MNVVLMIFTVFACLFKKKIQSFFMLLWNSLLQKLGNLQGVVAAFQKPLVTLKVAPKGLGKKKQGSIPTSSENLSMRRVTRLVVKKSSNFFKVHLLCAMGDSLPGLNSSLYNPNILIVFSPLGVLRFCLWTQEQYPL